MSITPSAILGFSYIYALFVDGKIQYVGQTVSPINRFASHRTNSKRIKAALAAHDCEFRVLRRCRLKDTTRIEGQIISTLKSRGLCSLNKVQPRKQHGAANRAACIAVRFVETGELFPSKSQAADAIGCSTSWLSQYIASGQPFEDTRSSDRFITAALA